MENLILYAALYVGLGFVMTYLLFLVYVFVMGVKRVRDRKQLTTLAYVLSWPIIALGVLIDVVVNQLYFSVICFDFKHFGTVTSRMKRYKYQPASAWQKKVSAFVERHIDDFEDVENGHI